jgi:hypothetical protein
MLNRNDPNVPRKPGLEPLSRRGDRDDFDVTTYRYGLVAAVAIAGVAMIGAVVWATRTDHGSANAPQAQATEQGAKQAPPPK